MKNCSEETLLICITCLNEIFEKEPFLVVQAYESKFDFEILINAVKNANPEMALASIEFWDKFIMNEKVIYPEDF